ncbi:MAG TPA: S41 family peptidase [Gemmatimonadaceae bacterium]|nr:S41 family peptidase [Gemmatimonadaceae bacterium]
MQIKTIRPLFLLLIAPAIMEAQPILRRDQIPVLDAKLRGQVVDSIASEFVRLYVDADTGKMIAAHIRDRARAHAYDQLTDPRAFSDALTQDLRAINGDKHLNVGFNPNAHWDRPGKGGIVDDTGVVQHNSPEDEERARRDHWGLGRADILPGNVGYMKVNGFEGSRSALDLTSAALKYLEGTDAMIFDLRGMGGGDGDQSNFLISHFTGPDSLATLRVSNRSSGKSWVRYTKASIPGKRRADIPVFILTDQGTASAGEDFAFVLQQLRRARTVGDRTAGAGHNNDFVDAGHGFGVSISYTRVADSRTGKEWERVGVQPDIKVDPRDALAAAQVAALDTLQKLAKDPEWARVVGVAKMTVLAQWRPVAIAPQTLASYTGTYAGGRVVALENGALVFRRVAARPPRPLLPVDDSTFVLTDISVSFRRGANGAMEMVQHLPDGPFVLPREGDVPAQLGR